MNLKYLVDVIKNISLLQPNVRTATEGDIYDTLNGNPNVKYSVVHITQNNYVETDTTTTFNLSIFFIDRLLNDYSNKLQIQSVGKELISNILKSLDETFDTETSNITFQPFTEKFNDLCAGCYANVAISCINDVSCAEQYGEYIKPIIQVINNQDITITENGLYLPQEGYSGFGEVKVEVDVEEFYEKGFEEGIAEQKSKIQPITITENGTYTNENGYSPINVNLDLESIYDEGVVNGKEEQKSLLESIKITENGIYDNENGYDVVNVEIDTQGYYNEGFSKGKTEGIEQGKEEGKEEQKSLIQPITITENGTYTNENGYSPINVNLDLESIYNEGYNNGEVNGIAQGKEEQKALLESITITENGNYTNENGYNEVVVNVGGTPKPKLPNGITLQGSTFSSIDMSNWDWEHVYDWGEMFADCRNLVEIQNFPTDIEILATARMFQNCGKLTSLDLSSFDTSKVINMSNMFYGCYKLIPLDVSSFNTSNVTDMQYMFYNCYKLTSLDVSSFDTSNVTNMQYMFSNCKSLTSLDVSSFDTSNVTNMQYMFQYCNNLTSLDLSSFNTSNVTDMQYMFSYCNKLTSLDLSSFDTSKVTYMSDMFSNCRNLTSISNIDITNVSYMSYMFNNCYKLQSITFKGKPTSSLSTSAMFNSAGTESTNPILYYPSEFADDYQKIINALPSKWTAVPY